MMVILNNLNLITPVKDDPKRDNKFVTFVKGCFFVNYFLLLR